MIVWNIGKILLISCLITVIRCNESPKEIENTTPSSSRNQSTGQSITEKPTEIPCSKCLVDVETLAQITNALLLMVNHTTAISNGNQDHGKIYTTATANSTETPETRFPRKTFSCRDGTYIANEHFCDGVFHCDDGVDEPPNCIEALQVCGTSGQFLYSYNDSEKICMNADEISDVVNYQEYYLKQTNSEISRRFIFNCDDKRCTKRLTHSSTVDTAAKEGIKKNCTSSNETFACEDAKRCLNLEYVCDGYCNCFDCSDENKNCLVVYNKTLASCHHSYLPSLPDAKCVEKDTRLSEHVENCTHDDICDQDCLLYKKRVMCSCGEEYVRLTDGENSFRCRHKDFRQDVIIYATSTQLKYLNLTTGKSDVLQKSSEITALTATPDHLYYAIFSNKSASIVEYSFSSRHTRVIKPGNRDSPIMSMVVDYSKNNFYFIVNSTLMFYNTSDKTCVQFSSRHVNHIASAPHQRLMFYSYTKKNGDSAIWSIIVVHMNGSEEVTLIEEIHSPITFLVTDESIKRLYWLETNTLFSVPFIGDTRDVRTYEHLENVVSITAHDSRVFYTTLYDSKIYILQNRQNFTNSIGKLSNHGFNAFGYLKKSSQRFDDQFSVGNFITAKYLYACRNKEINTSRMPETTTHSSSTPAGTTANTATKSMSTTPSISKSTTTATTATSASPTSSSTPSPDHSPNREEQKGDQESKSGSKFWQIFFVIIVLIVAAFGLYVWYNKSRNQYTHFNARTFFRNNFYHSNDYDQNEL